MLPENPKNHADLLARFRWNIPERFNIGTACADDIARLTPDRPAIIDYADGEPRTLSFKQLAERSSRFAAALKGIGIRRGERVAVMLPQSIEAAVAHLGIYKLGAIAVPLAMQFGPEAMQHRLATSGARALIADLIGLERLASIQPTVPALEFRISVDGTEATHDFNSLISKASAHFPIADTSPNDPAMMLFTSGTTGQPKGTLHAHRVLLGHLPGIQMAQGFMPQKDDRLWTPSDWAWAGGLLNALLPALYCGVTVVAARAPKFEADWAINLIKKAGVRNIFMPPTALKLMQANLSKLPELNIRSIGSAGEALGEQTLEWAKEHFGVSINEFYGQTECNAVISACHEIGTVKPGSMGKSVPGHQVTILNEAGSAAQTGETGEIAIHKDSPVMFLRYFDNKTETERKFNGEWMLTGDRAYRDEDGYFHFVGRNDDIIISAGYRIGPAEIEDCLTAHPAVELAAVTGKADATRTQIVLAHIKLVESEQPSEQLKSHIRNFVKTRLSAHEYPREIIFVNDIPMTESGKIIRRAFRNQTA
jgi:acetyl-CoA synthetase